MKPSGVLQVVTIDTMVVEGESSLETTDGPLLSIVAIAGIIFNTTNITSS